MSTIISGSSPSVTFSDGTTQTTALPTPGTSGNVPVSNGTAWVSQAPVTGAMTKIGTLTASNNMPTFTGLSGYDKYMVIATEINAGGPLTVTFGYGATPTYITSGYWYAAIYYQVGGSISASGSSIQTTAFLSTWNSGNIFGSSVIEGMTTLGNVTASNVYGTTGYRTNTVTSGVATGGNAITALQFNSNGSNITSGTISLYGISS